MVKKVFLVVCQKINEKIILEYSKIFFYICITNNLKFLDMKELLAELNRLQRDWNQTGIRNSHMDVVIAKILKLNPSIKLF